MFDEVEISTFADIAALFSAAHDLVNSQPLFRTILIAQTMRAITCDSGFQFQPQATTSDHPPLDILLIPGGRGITNTGPSLVSPICWRFSSDPTGKVYVGSATTGCY